MKVQKLSQSGPDWHRWRQNGLGGSDAPALLGDVQWTSPDELVEQKLGLRTVEENERMARGKRLEPEARAKYILQTGIDVSPVCVTHDTHEWLRASLDGISADHQTIVEIKCPSYWAHYKAARKGHYPDYYKAQLMHQLLVTGAKVLHYFSYNPDNNDGPAGLLPETALVIVEPDEEYMATLLRRELDFWERVQKHKQGKPLAKQEKPVRTSRRKGKK